MTEGLTEEMNRISEQIGRVYQGWFEGVEELEPTIDELLWKWELLARRLYQINNPLLLKLREDTRSEIKRIEACCDGLLELPDELCDENAQVAVRNYLCRLLRLQDQFSILEKLR